MSEATAETGSVREINSTHLLDALDLPMFMLDAEGTVAAWNEQTEDVIGLDREEVLGRSDLGGYAYDEPGKKTLAEKVFEQPDDAHRVYDDVEVTEEEYALLDTAGGRVYEDTSTLGETALWFIAAPLYEEGELAGVVELVQDRSESIRRKEEIERLFDELAATIDAYAAGKFDTRTTFDTEESILEDDLLGLVTEVNDLGAEMQETIREIEERREAETRVVESVETTVDDLTELSAEVARTAGQADTLSNRQQEQMAEITEEVSNLSATIEEIASTADQVDTTSTRAESLAEEGYQAAEDSIGAMEEIEESTEMTVANIGDLQDRIGEIDEIVEVIDEIADQTNILAVNASIEAARAGEAGDGFAVVADEVKQLAEESQSHADDIETMVNQIEDDAAATIATLERTTEHIENGIDQVEESMGAFSDIVDATAETSRSIQEVADATDDQAASSEEIAAMVDQASTHADDLSEQMSEIADANERQAARVADIDETIESLSER